MYFKNNINVLQELYNCTHCITYINALQGYKCAPRNI